MTDQIPEDVPPPKNQERSDRRWSRAGVIVTTIAALIALIAWLVPISAQEDSTDTGATSRNEYKDSQPHPDNNSQYPNQAKESQESSGSESSCFDDGQKVSCAARHSAELVQMDTCDQNSLSEYMGGDSDRDVVIGTLRVDAHEDGCLISGFNPEATVSVKDALKDQAGDAFRSCWDGSANAEVPCDVPHSAEQVFRGGTDEIDCEQKYYEYVDRAYFRDKDDLALKLSSGTGSSCWAEVRGNDLLKGSIRSLGDRAIPFSEPQD